MFFVGSFAPTFADELTPTLGDDSAYTLTEVSSDGDGVITEYEYDRDTNTLTPKYYELNLKNKEYGTGGKSKTIDVDVLGKKVPITVKYDDSTTKTYANTYTSPINNTSTITIEDAIFDNVQASSPLVYNSKGTITSITSDFISNKVTVKNDLDGGGLVGNYLYFISGGVYTSTIGDITGDFISNTVTVTDIDGGGLIGNYSRGDSCSSTIGDITGDFISNTVTVTGIDGGGLIGNYSNPNDYQTYTYSIINDITGDFISNTVTASTMSGGGLIGNYSFKSNSAIGNITGDFISNTVTASTMSGGGLIGNYSLGNSCSSTIGDIIGDFISNSVELKGNYVYGGGLIGNYSSVSATIGNIRGNFVSNTITISNILFGGGLIGNYAYSSSIGDIRGDFISNTVTASTIYGGGLIGNRPMRGNTLTITIGDIVGNFISNNVIIEGKLFGGGLIGVYKSSTIGDITGDFISNTVTASTIYGGGLIGVDSRSIIGNITGDFISNTVTVTDIDGGGLIGVSRSTIGNITGDFISNTVTASTIYGGGLIGVDSRSTIGDITGDFISNTVTASTMSGGGLIGVDNSSTIGDITGDFISNTVTASTMSGGGLIGVDNSSTIGNINSNFYNNIVRLTGTSNQIIAGGVIGNYVVDDSTKAIINSISGFFENNRVVKETGYATVYAGVIYNTGTITNGITNSTFKNNYVKLAEGTAYASVIYTTKNLSINADNGITLFSGNYSQIGNGEKNYNAVYVDSSSATLTLNATNNGVIQLEDNINGANGYNVRITGDSTGVVNLYNDIKNANVITGTVTISTANNDIHEYEFGSLDSNENTKYSIDVDITNKKSDTFVVGNGSTGRITLAYLNIISGSFDDIIDKNFKIQVVKSKNDNIQLELTDELISQLPNTIYEIGKTIRVIQDEVKQNTKWNEFYKEYNQDIIAYGKLGLATTETTNDSIGVSYDHSELGEITFSKYLDTLAHVNRATNVNNKSFNFDASSNVYTVTENLGETAEGTLNINGVLSTTDVVDEATGIVSSVQETSTINFNNKSGFELNNSTKLNVNNTMLTNALGSSNGSVISANNSDAEINLKNTSLVNNISTGKGGAIYSKADVNISADNAIVNIYRNIDVDGNNAIYLDNAGKTLTLKSTNNAIIKLDDKINGETGYKVSISGDDTSNVVINNNIDNANVTLGSTNIYLSKENLLNNSVSVTMDNTNLSVVNNSVGEMNVPTFNLVGISNIKVDADLENKVMDRIIASNYNISDGAVLNVSGINITSPTTERKVSIPFADSQFANNVAYTGINPVAYSPIYKYKASYDVNEADGMGYFTFVRGASGDSNSYNPSVLAPSVAQQTGTYTTQLNTFNYAFQHADLFMNMPTDWRIAYKNRNKYATSNVGVFSPLMTGEEMNGFWVKPYATFENVPLKNGPKVNSISYGTLVGYDEPMTSLKYGWDRVFTYYLGYNGASQNFSGIDCYQNGGLLGATMTLYKGNFFTATTLSAGATVGESHTMYGTEFSTTMFAGIGNKTGYNIEFKQGKFIIQPSMLLAYTFLNTFDYKNSAGVQINSDPTSMIQIAPTLRFVVNTKTGWQPYLAVGMVWNILAHSNIKANGEELPDMYTKPYVQYGLGLQKVVKDRFTAFGQAMIYNGGRNGISLSAGVRYALGKENSKHSAGTPKIVKEIKPAMMDSSKNIKNVEITENNTVQVSNKNIKKTKNDKKYFDFKLQQTSISIVR